jgi:hypothetical protein
MSTWATWIGWRRRPPLLRRTGLVVPVVFLPCLQLGTVRQARYYLLVLAILIPLVLLYLRNSAAKKLSPGAMVAVSWPDDSANDCDDGANRTGTSFTAGAGIGKCFGAI